MSGRRHTWRSLLPGLVAIVAMVAAVVVVLVFARIGALHGDTFRLYAYTDEARGVLEGTEVWLAGQKVGLVAGVEFRPVGSDTAQRLRLSLDILERYRPLFRRDSYAQIRSGGSLIGAPVVYVTPGSSAAAPLRSGDLLASRRQLDTEAFTSEMAIASRQFPEIVRNLRKIGGDVRRTGARLEGRGADVPSVALEVVGSRAAGLGRRILGGEGTLGLALRSGDDALMTRAVRAAARADSVLSLLDDGNGILVRLESDSTLVRTVADARNELSIVRALMAESRGSAGRFLHDSAVVRELARLERELGATMKDAKRNPVRYIAF